ncbi:MAG: hypothetical protein J5482_02860 [Oscillospiraceae bacterium]|nr:hypothetical protein [Oscillospiraceae bacterium]
MNEERMTARRDDGVVGLSPKWMKGATLGEKINLALERLAEYEETGLTADEAATARWAVHIVGGVLWLKGMCRREDKSKCYLQTMPTMLDCCMCLEKWLLSTAKEDLFLERAEQSEGEKIEGWVPRYEDTIG